MNKLNKTDWEEDLFDFLDSHVRSWVNGGNRGAFETLAYVRQVRQEAYEKGLNEHIAGTTEVAQGAVDIAKAQARKKALEEALAAIPGNYGLGPDDTSRQLVDNLESHRMNNLLEHIRQSIQELITPETGESGKEEREDGIK